MLIHFHLISRETQPLSEESRLQLPSLTPVNRSADQPAGFRSNSPDRKVFESVYQEPHPVKTELFSSSQENILQFKKNRNKIKNRMNKNFHL